MKRLIVPAAFAIFTLLVYMILTIPFLVLIYIESVALWILFAFLYQCISLGFAVELSELTWGLILPPRKHMRASRIVQSKGIVAVLYVCCDDIDETALHSLKNIQDTDVFILDDSELIESQKRVDCFGFCVIRRGTRDGYKAGNLNNWLCQFAPQYKYFVILDSDSIMSSSAIWELVKYAEHKSNEDVAIVQSHILTRQGNRFQKRIGAISALRMRILSSLHDRLGWSLSHGHNNLHRTQAIISVGGFDQSASCEDTLVSLNLLRMGWRIILVDTQSYDHEPANIFSYRQRYLRWAWQTVDVLSVSNGILPWKVIVLMAKHLFTYLLPFACFALFSLNALFGQQVRATQFLSVLDVNILFSEAHISPGILIYIPLGAFLLLILLRFVGFLSIGKGFYSFINSSLLAGAAGAFCLFHTASVMLRSALGHRSEFRPTGAQLRYKPDLIQITRAMLISWLIYLLITVQLVINSASLLLSYNLIWLAIIVTSPFVLWLFHSDQQDGR